MSDNAGAMRIVVNAAQAGLMSWAIFATYERAFTRSVL